MVTHFYDSDKRVMSYGQVAGNGPASNKGGRHSIMTTLVDAEAAQVCEDVKPYSHHDLLSCTNAVSARVVSSSGLQMLLPIFLESLHKVSRRLVPRLLVLASDAQGLKICRAKHAHCLPWFQRLNTG